MLTDMMRKLGAILCRCFAVTACTCLLVTSAHAAEAGLDGRSLTLIWVLPFAILLLSIAIMPVAAAEFWHHNYGKVAAACAIAFIVPAIAVHGFAVTLHDVLHAMLLEYVPFVILLLTLFTVAGGVVVRGNLHGSPALNTGIIALGTAFASVAGTTGASMLLIRPLIRANDNRRHNVHVIVFFIFLVGNIGGSLTPLGDPPLFLGFLKGVDFFWPTVNLLMPMLLLVAILLTLFYAIDWYCYSIDDTRPQVADPTPDSRIRIDGWVNVALLGAVVVAVLMSGVWKPGVSFDIAGIKVELQNIVRDIALLGIAWASLKLTRPGSREANGFSWGPIIEVAKLFAGIFVTIIPAIAILKAGSTGALGPVVDLVTDASGKPDNVMYFWLTGILSSFLDNAPTYLVFFNLAGGDAAALMGPLSQTLVAISAGAVFMGANTYIGNAPNFMIKAIAEERGIKMPSFFGYMAWSMAILLPCFVLITVLFFGD
ncbi:MAG: sodium:proton antiporter [Hyphomicrobium aestuarii]|nr:sodium:proton antiporter [Hyphomicrobium aestuarii]